MNTTDVDASMMRRCIELARDAASAGEYPFAAVIARNELVAAEAINSTVRENDVSRHAEVIALSAAQKKLTQRELREHTLYTIVEPCAMCSFCIREAWIGRVVSALASPIMGGLSKWNILRDDVISSRMPQIFAPVPEVVSGLLLKQAREVWRGWNPLAWQMIELRGLLIAAGGEDGETHMEPGGRLSLAHYLQLHVWRHLLPSARKKRRS